MWPFPQCFWALGACLEVLLALVVMPTLGWRWLLGLSALPIFIFFIMCYVSEAANKHVFHTGMNFTLNFSVASRERPLSGRERWDGEGLVHAQEDREGQRATNVARPTGRWRHAANGTWQDEGSPHARNEKNDTAPLVHLVSLQKKIANSSWFELPIHFSGRMTCAFCYYGVVLLSTEILGDTPRHRSLTSSPTITMFGNSSSSSTTLSPLALSLVQGNGTSIMSECKNPDHKMLTQSDYIDLLWTTLAEFPGLVTIDELSVK